MIGRRYIFGSVNPDHLRDLEVLQCSGMPSKELGRKRIWDFSTSGRRGRFGSVLSAAAPARLSLEARPISIAPGARVGGPPVSAAGLTPMPPIPVGLPISSVLRSVGWLWQLSAPIRGLLVVSVLWRLPTFSPAVVFINPVLDDLWSSIWFQLQGRVRTFHCCRPACWFFRPALGFKGGNWGRQTGVELAISSSCLLEVDAHHEGRAPGTISSCSGLLWGQFACIGPSCGSTPWGTSGGPWSSCTRLKRKRVLFSLLKWLI